ncbi:Stem cell self-renewal protein Piwi [Cordyceps militaris CM01]|uniref:Stem cell self-renewal protein Piwi n=1 Tax=Cordyceps militaris (strain CM01) TaxID=983644 RepID=G3JHI6_CORMM|nr:Stem cell self-renewal protein Piwi [Cordyceps militaris CM01]EGX90894.1 Stem cell self-renewal protein Piwi [Cordyceps militaris CM01]
MSPTGGAFLFPTEVVALTREIKAAAVVMGVVVVVMEVGDAAEVMEAVAVVMDIGVVVMDIGAVVMEAGGVAMEAVVLKRRQHTLGKMRLADPNQTAAPDPAIQQLENQLVKQQSDELMQRIKKPGKAPARAVFGEHLPARPAFGDQGRAIIVWANSFAVTAKPITLYKYGLNIDRVFTAEQKEKGRPKQVEVRGRKLQFVIAKLLDMIRDVPGQVRTEAKATLEQAKKALKEVQKAGNKQAVADARAAVDKAAAAEKATATLSDNNKLVVSEFKSQIVSSKELQLTHNPIRVVLLDEALEDGAPPREEHFDVELMDAVPVNFSEMLDHVASMKVHKDDNVFPRHPEVVDVLNMILGFHPRSNIDSVSAVGSSRFYPFASHAQTASLMEDFRPLIAARGFFQSVRLATGRVLLNTQVTHGVFKLSGQATKIFEQLEIEPCPSGHNHRDYQMIKTLKAFSKCLSKVRASVTFRTTSGREVKRVKAIEGLVFASDMTRKRGNKGPNADKFAPNWELCGPSHVSFWNAEDKKYVTVKQHFKNKYGLELGNYPLFNFGNGDKNSYFPAEVVEIQQGQQAKLKLTAKETSDMLTFACRPPYANARTLVKESRELLGHDNPLLQQLGVCVSKQLIAVNARIINQPKVRYDKGKIPEIRNGSWNLMSASVLKSGPKIAKWAYVDILYGDRSPPIGPDKLDSMITAWQRMGINIQQGSTFSETATQYDITQKLDDIFKKSQSKGVQLIVFILFQKDSGPLYSRIKTLGDCIYGIHTSCIVRKQVENGSPGTLANLGLKVNLKFGGVNQKLCDDLDILKGGTTMFVGYDVTHPTNMEVPKSGVIPPSLVGLVSSIDNDLGQWPSVTWEQNSKQEILGPALEHHFASRIDLWRKKNGGKPLENIIIYRDGVSESQFATVLKDELPSIRKAAEKKFPQDPPKLTMIVSVKRHQTRFYPADEANLSGSSNIKNGTVVDRGVTQARYWDFYLTAHHALKGTARPAHYSVLLDEIFRPRYKLGAANELEKLTHELCYLFGRATMAVSICPPAYYADLVCERARAHRPEYAGADDVSEMSGSVSSMHGPAQAREIHQNLRDTMFYM